jgi:atlastin
MPHPGLKVSSSPTFEGCLKDIDEDFKCQLHDLIPALLSPKSLVVKTVNGVKMTGRGLVECFKSYLRVFQGEELPEPKSVLEATAEANNLVALAAALDHYSKTMEKVCGGDKPFISPTDLEESHNATKLAAIELFRTTRKMGGPQVSQEYQERLETQIEDLYSNFCKQNNAKNIFNAARTPAVFITLILACYVFKYIVGFIITIVFLEHLLSFIIFASFAMLAVWGYARWSGELRDAAQVIDYVTEFLWDQVFAEIYARVVMTTISHQIGAKQKRQ